MMDRRRLMLTILLLFLSMEGSLSTVTANKKKKEFETTDTIETDPVETSETKSGWETWTQSHDYTVLAFLTIYIVTIFQIMSIVKQPTFVDTLFLMMTLATVTLFIGYFMVFYGLLSVNKSTAVIFVRHNFKLLLLSSSTPSNPLLDYFVVFIQHIPFVTFSKNFFFFHFFYKCRFASRWHACYTLLASFHYS